MPAIVLTIVIVLAGCTTSLPASPPRPTLTAEEKIAREVERAQDATIRDVIWTVRRQTSRAIRDLITGR